MKAKIILYLEMPVYSDNYKEYEYAPDDRIRASETRHIDLDWREWIEDNKKDLKLLGRVVEVTD